MVYNSIAMFGFLAWELALALPLYLRLPPEVDYERMNMTDVEVMQSCTCPRMLPLNLQLIGILSICSFIFGILAYYGSKIKDQGTFLKIYTIVSVIMGAQLLRLIVVEENYETASATTANFESATNASTVASSGLNLRNTENEKLLKNDDEDDIEVDNRQKVSSTWVYALHHYGLDLKSTIVMNQLHKEGKCCGLWGPEDWYHREKYVPRSCCRQDNCNTTYSNDIYTEGCSSFINRHSSGTKVSMVYLLYTLMFIQFSGYAIIAIHRLYPDPYLNL